MNTNTMRSAIDWPVGSAPPATTLLPPAPRLRHAGLLGFRLLLATLPALALLVGTAWIVGTFDRPYVLHAAVWAGGFVFLALAMESTRLNVGALLATGLALPVLAMLSARVAAEFAVLAAALIAVWIAAVILGRYGAGNS